MSVVLVINCGSSSIKFCLFQMPGNEDIATGILEKIGNPDSRLVLKNSGNEHIIEQPINAHPEGMQLILKTLTDPNLGIINEISEIHAVGHRVVHGGEAYHGSVLIDDTVIQTIRDFSDLAPLHNPPNLSGIHAAMSVLPEVPHTAVFDTAFHQTIPEKAYLYALPYEFYEKFRIRRYGFHGSSHDYVASRAAMMLDKPREKINLITCHLGNGCSLTAIKNGKSVDTSMGLTPLEGLAMGTRSGDIDPAIIFFLSTWAGGVFDIKSINTTLNKKSGLLGISGISNDVRNITEVAEQGHERARLALDVFAYRIRKYIGSYMAVLGSVDAIVFTGGIGENSSGCRYDALSDLAGFGIDIDPEKNSSHAGGEGDIAKESSRTRVFVIPTNEEWYIANHAYEVSVKQKEVN
ncbi:acetate kinase [Candidatus Riflebacteria bacterium]